MAAKLKKELEKLVEIVARHPGGIFIEELLHLLNEETLGGLYNIGSPLLLSQEF